MPIWPIAVPVTILILYLLGKLLKEPCDLCGSEGNVARCFDSDCEKKVCTDCGRSAERYYKEWEISEKEGLYCPSHYEKIQKLKNAIDKSEWVEVFSKNYRGRTPPITKNKLITTKPYRNRDHANRELKILAALEDCNVVVKAEFIKKERSSWENPNYIYSMWKYKGLI